GARSGVANGARRSTATAHGARSANRGAHRRARGALAPPRRIGADARGDAAIRAGAALGVRPSKRWSSATAFAGALPSVGGCAGRVRRALAPLGAPHLA